MTRAIRQILSSASTGLIVLLLTMGGCIQPSGGAAPTSSQHSDDLNSQLEACRREHERQVSRAEVEALRAELRRYAQLTDQETHRRAAMQRAMDEYAKGVCLMHGIFTMYDRRDATLAQVADSDGNPLILEYLGRGSSSEQTGKSLPIFTLPSRGGTTKVSSLY